MSQNSSGTALDPLRSTPTPDAAVDMFADADVSHHGGALFEMVLSSISSPLRQPSMTSDQLYYEAGSIFEHATHISPGRLSHPGAASPDSAPRPPPLLTEVFDASDLPRPTHPASTINNPPKGLNLPSPPRKVTRRTPVARRPPSTPIAKRRSQKPNAPPAIRRKPSRANTMSTDDSDRSNASNEQIQSSVSKSAAIPANKNPLASAATERHPRTNAVTPSPNAAALPKADSEPPPGIKLPIKRSHNADTRRCRAKVNDKFQELLHILPTPPSEASIKHKAQILEYTITVVRDCHARKTLLEARLALSSPKHLNDWVKTVVSRSTSLNDMLLPYLSLISTKGRWKYSEAWVGSPAPPSSANINAANAAIQATSGTTAILRNDAALQSWAMGPTSKLRLGLAAIPPLGNAEDPDDDPDSKSRRTSEIEATALQAKLERFRDRSRAYGCRAREDLPGRVLCTMRPEWLPSLDNREVFKRSKVAHDASLAMCFGVPVFVQGRVAAVALFFDTNRRVYDAACVDQAVQVASMLGNAFGSSDSRANSGRPCNSGRPVYSGRPANSGRPARRITAAPHGARSAGASQGIYPAIDVDATIGVGTGAV